MDDFGEWFFVSEDCEVFPLRVLDSYSSEFEIDKRVLTIQTDVLSEIEKRMRVLRKGTSRDDLRAFLLRGCFANNFVVTYPRNGVSEICRRRWFSDGGDFEASSINPDSTYLYLTTDKPDFDADKPACFLQED